MYKTNVIIILIIIKLKHFKIYISLNIYLECFFVFYSVRKRALKIQQHEKHQEFQN